MMKGIALLAAAVLTVPAASSAERRGAQDPLTLRPDSVPMIWQGVYTTEQAARGEAVFDSRCSACHGEARGDGPPLAGSRFLNNWLEDSVGSLVSKIQTTMPSDAPGALSTREVIDVTSFVLQTNGFPSGPRALPADVDALGQIPIVGRNGPAPVPNFSVVIVAGCLMRNAEGAWILTSATEPVRGRHSSAGERLKRQPASGEQMFRLMDAAAASPDAHAGQRVVVQGLLMREPAETKLNVISIEGVGTRCE